MSMHKWPVVHYPVTSLYISVISTPISEGRQKFNILLRKPKKFYVLVFSSAKRILNLITRHIWVIKWYLRIRISMLGILCRFSCSFKLIVTSNSVSLLNYYCTEHPKVFPLSSYIRQDANKNSYIREAANLKKNKKKYFLVDSPFRPLAPTPPPPPST